MTRTAFAAATLLLAACSGVEREDSHAVAIDQVPPAVRKTIEAHLDGGQVKEIEHSTEKGKAVYEVEVKGAKGTSDFRVGEDGAFLGADREDEEHEDGKKEEDD